MMRTSAFVVFALALTLSALPARTVLAAADIAKHTSCRHCGMDRGKWDFSRVYLEYDDGSTEGACSIHCAAVDLAVNLDKSPKTIWVADYATKQLIDSEKAVWVIGGAKPGVMTNRAKWAFSDRAAAESFVKESQGVIATFDEVMKGAYLDMYEDTKTIRERRAAKRKAAAEERHKGPRRRMTAILRGSFTTAGWEFLSKPSSVCSGFRAG